MYPHRAFNLNILSELYLPELIDISPQSTAPFDVHIVFGEVSPTGISASLSSNLFYQANEHALWLHVPNVARFLITDGCHIKIDPMTDVDQESIRVFLLGSCMGALLMQRNLFLLHANAIRVGNVCISFAGHSGVGKSTLCAAFFKRGYNILADDVCAINDCGDVVPGFPQIKLWFDAAKHLNIKTESLRKIRPNIEKFAVPLGEQFHAETLPLKLIYILNEHNKDDFRFDAITGMHKIQPLKTNTYRRHYLKSLAKDHSHLQQCGKIANKTSLIRLTRPNHGFKIDELVNLIEKDLETRGILHV